MKPNFDDFSTFIAVARRGSFRQASDELGVTASAVSHAIRQLEQKIGLRLLNRTTRSVSLTDAGQELYERLAPAFEDIACTLEELNRYRDSPVGRLRINSVRTGARLYLAPLVASFRALYPGVVIDMTLDDAITDIVEHHFDAGVRLSAIVEKDMIAIPISPPVRYVVVATPAFLDAHGRPGHPADLPGYSCIAYRYQSGRPHQWSFQRRTEKLEVAPGGTILVNDLDIALDLALAGAGLGYVLHAQAAAFIESGQLVPLFEDWLPEQAGFHLYYPGRKYLPSAFRAFIDYVREHAHTVKPVTPARRNKIRLSHNQ